ncbi:hydroxysqualene dehydroxylase HpnE [Planctomicrobium sp. SH661]|uniref:hydroxysqualene dehydroxylase HpnE n=1 Tax=Planctomicrobium sp. SH661 TaxID=3448124 RepID=UPI003F5CB98C
MPKVAVVGGGLAGIAAATALAQAGLKVTLLETRQALGGRATSYTDAESGAVIDNCQHVSMGCCTNLRHLCTSLQIDTSFETQDELYFISPSGIQTTFRADPLPAPFHLTRAFWRMPELTFSDKWRFAHAVRKLASSSPDSLAGQNFHAWLKRNGQSDELIRNVWEVVLVSALSESLDRIDAVYARKVMVDGFLTNSSGWKVEIPRISLDELYSDRTLSALQLLGVEVHCQARVASIVSSSRMVQSLLLQDGREIIADQFVLAVPQHQLGVLLSTQPALHPLSQQIEQIQTAPITSIHLWFDRPVMTLPHAVLVGRLGQWVFARGTGQTPRGTGYLYQVVISASRHLHEMTQQQVVDHVVEELQSIWPDAAAATLLHHRMITERRAVFSVAPGIDHLRPTQQTAIGNLQLAGDWTQTGWPATMEGAVRSGYLASANILHSYGISAPAVQPDLPRGWLASWLWGRK